MFCSGNVTERMRMGRQRAIGETVVDLYCGIGYYGIPLLVYGKAAFLHAFEWNENSLLSLRLNLQAAGIPESKYKIHGGDNRILALSEDVKGVADRVLLGLLPSSEEGWPLAVRALNQKGGIIHVHTNVHKKEEENWVRSTCERFMELFSNAGTVMSVSCLHVERVKSYAPHVNHVVADLLCTQ